MTRRGSGPGPIVVLAVLVLVPAALLWATWQWAAGQAESFDMPPTTSVPVVVPEPSPPLSTTLASLRRTPAVLSRELNLEQFRDDVAPLIEAVNDRSCVSVSLDGVPVGGRNTAAAVIPASVQKVMVGAVALEILGPDFVYTTEVRGAGPVDGVVAGDLHLVGGGDPVLSGDWYPTSNLERFPVFNQTSLDTLADSVVAAGVRRVGGNVVGDASRYDDEWFAPGWGAGVAGLEAGPYDALMANDARVLGDDRRASDPGQAAARELERLLVDRGVVIEGTPVSGTAPDGLDLIAAIDSLPLHAIVDEMLANSDNNTAELMVKEIGLAASGEGSRPAGLAAMLAVLQEWGIDVSELVMADGSGLSPSNLLTCDAVLAVLQRFEPDGHLGTGLPVAASSGTLRNVFTDHAVAGRLLGKTGTLNNPPFNQDPPAVKGLAGYLPVDGGGSVEYVLLLNGPTISDQSEYRPVWDLLGRVLDTYPAGAGPAALGPR